MQLLRMLKTHREGETVGHFQHTANIQTKQLTCNQSRRKLLTVLNDLQYGLCRRAKQYDCEYKLPYVCEINIRKKKSCHYGKTF